MPYYYDEKRGWLYEVPLHPECHPRKKGGEIVEWVVTAEIELYRPDNYTNGRGRWAYDVRLNPSERYDAFRDPKDKAISYFKVSKYPNHPRVSDAEGERIKKEIESQINKNTEERRTPPNR